MVLGSLLGGAAGGAGISIVISAVDNFSKTFKSAETQIQGLTGFVQKNALAIGATGAALTGMGVAGVVAMSNLTNTASDLQESVNAVQVTFRDASDEILKIGENAATSFGMSKNEFNQSAVMFSAFAETVAGEGGNVARVINDITTRTADFASVMNLDLARAQTVIQSGLAGETEALRRFGIDVSAASIKTYAYANGIAETGTELTEQQKILARYRSIMEQTEKMAGDFANTSDSLANKQRILSASITDLKAKLGETLLPAFESIVGVIQKVVDWFSNLNPQFQKFIVIGGAVATVLALVIGPLLILIGLFAPLLAGLAAGTITVGGLAAAVWALTWPILAVIAAIAALIAIGWMLYKHWDSIMEQARNVQTVIENAFISVRNVIAGVWNNIVGYAEDSINRIVDMINWLIKKINKIPGIDIGKISDFNFDKFEVGMADYVKAPSSRTERNSNTIYIENVNGLTGKDIANSLQDELDNVIRLG